MWLNISSDGRSGAPVQVERGRLVVGRGPGSDILVDDPYVSLQHVALEIGTDGVTVIDLRSTNGTYVEGHRIEHAVALVPPANIKVGDTMIELLASAPTAAHPIATAPSPRPPSPPPPPPPRPAPTAPPLVGATNTGPAAGRDVRIHGARDAIGRDLVINEGFTLKTRMRSSAKACIRWGCVSMLLGTALVGYFVITWNAEIFSVIGTPGDLANPPPQPNLPSPVPWLPLGFALSFGGVCLLVAGLLIPRERFVTEDRR
jgi:pSer/pThr/pTyr-binding forkhead associated (FHA) protein